MNPLQFRLLEAWRGDRYDVTAVGDPQQAIYGWNGADAGFLLDIHRHWPPGRGHRAAPQLPVDAGDPRRRRRRAPGRQAGRPRRRGRPGAGGPPPHLSGHDDDRAEAIAIARAIRLAHAPGRPWAEQAVLVRTNAQTHLIAEALREAGIPYRIRGGAAFLDRADVRRALRDLRSSPPPLGTALADLELLQEDALADERPRRGRRARRGRRRPRAPPPAPADEHAAIGALLRMGRDYLRLDPVGGADSFAGWLTATVQSEGDTSGRAATPSTSSTFHAAKGLEWAVVHLAGRRGRLRARSPTPAPPRPGRRRPACCTSP